MDAIELPLMRAQDPIESALQRMSGADARAVVVQHAPDVYRLHVNRELFAALRAEHSRCGEIRGGREVASFDTAPADFEGALDAAGRQYGIVRATTPRIRLTSRHEALVAEIRAAPKVCRCTKAGVRHAYDCPPESEGAECPMGDGTLECF